MPPSYCLVSLLIVTLALSSAWAAVGEPGDLASFDRDGAVVNLRTVDGRLIRISFLGENLLRIQASMEDDLKDG